MKYLAVFTTFTSNGMGVCNMEITLTGEPTIKTVRELESAVKQQVGSQSAVLTNLIPLADAEQHADGVR